MSALATGSRPLTARDRRLDAVLAATLLVGAILSAALGAVAGLYGDAAAPLGWGLLYGVGLAVPLVFRRRWPATVLVVVSLVFFTGVTLRIPELYVGNIALFISMFTVGAWMSDRRRALLVRTLVVIAMFLWLLVATYLAAVDPDPDPEGLSRIGAFSPFAAMMLMQYLLNAAFFGGAWYMGDRSWQSAQERAQLEERTRELEREREVTAAQAVALDRVRIARELHDVVAHHVSAMGVQAGAARTVFARDPEGARRALEQVESSSREALSELRNLLETLRTREDHTPAASIVRLDHLPELVEHACENGLPTRLQIVGEPVEVPELTQVNLYRITQEALTNARRHGGTGVTADVRVRYDDGEIEVEVVNTGRTTLGASAGLGLVGMRERAAASGGTLSAGPRRSGGFLVRARVPVTAHTEREQP